MPRTKNDSFFKRSLEHPAIAQAFFAQHLPAHLKPLVALKALQRLDRTHTDERLKQRHRDILYAAPLQPHHMLLACTEHQGQPDPAMLVRLLRYDADGIEDYLRQHQQWPTVVNIVFTQAHDWPYPLSAEAAYERPELGLQELSIRYHLVAIQNFSDEEILSHGHCAPMELLIKHSESGRFELEAVAYRAVFEACLKAVGTAYLETMLTYAVSLKRKEAGKHMFDFISDVLIEQKDIIMTYGQQLRHEGMQQGVQQGREQGIQQVAKRLLSQLQLDIKAVQQATGLGKDVLKRLQKG